MPFFVTAYYYGYTMENEPATFYITKPAIEILLPLEQITIFDLTRR